jgi:hypothetical protein
VCGTEINRGNFKLHVYVSSPECRIGSTYEDSQNKFWNNNRVNISEQDNNKSKLLVHPRRNLEQIKLREYLLPFSSEFLTFPLLFYSKNIKTSVNYQNCILIVVLWECKPESFTLKLKYILRVLENMPLIGILLSKREEVTGNGTQCHNEELHNCVLRQVLEWSNRGGKGEVGMCIIFKSENLMGLQY